MPIECLTQRRTLWMSGIADKTLDSYECDKTLYLPSLFPNVNAKSDIEVDDPINELEIHEHTGIEAQTIKCNCDINLNSIP